MAGRARFGGMGVDVGEARLDLGDAVRIGGGFRLREQGRALVVGGEHDLDQRDRPCPALPAPPVRCACSSAARPSRPPEPRSPVMTRNSVDLPAPLRPTRPGLGAGRQRDGGVVEKQAAGNAGGNIGNRDHRRRFGPKRMISASAFFLRSASEGLERVGAGSTGLHAAQCGRSPPIAMPSSRPRSTHSHRDRQPRGARSVGGGEDDVFLDRRPQPLGDRQLRLLHSTLANRNVNSSPSGRETKSFFASFSEGSAASCRSLLPGLRAVATVERFEIVDVDHDERAA